MSFILLNVPILSGPGPGFDCLTINHHEMSTPMKIFALVASLDVDEGWSHNGALLAAAAR